MNVLVFGASSQIGHFLLPRLDAMQYATLAVSRQVHTAPSLASVRWLRTALPDFAVEGVPSALPDRFDAIVSFAPLQALSAWLAKSEIAPARRLIATSSMSAESKRDSAISGDRAVSRMLRDGEAALAVQCARLGMDFLILRPTLIYGAGMDKSLTPIARGAMKFRLFPLPLAGGLRQPVHADDVAQAVIAALHAEMLGGITVPVGGGERLAYADMFRRVHARLSVATLPLPIPLFVLHALAQVVPPMRGPVSRLEQDLIADNTELQRRLGIAPRRFQPEATMWQAPKSGRQ